MLTSILKPVVHGKKSRYSARLAWSELVFFYTLTNCTASVLVGLTSLAIGNFLARQHIPLEAWTLWSCMVVIAVYFPSQLGWSTGPPLIESTRQVPRTWAYDYPPWAAALLFGLALGNGLYTRIVVPTFYLLLLWSFLMPGSKLILVIWFVYGLTRSLNLWWLASAAQPPSPFFTAGRINARLVRNADWMYRGNAFVMMTAAAWLLTGMTR